MSIFKINLKPVIKDRDWEIHYVQSSRKDKVCGGCGKSISKTERTTTFTKRVSKGSNTDYTSKYTHGWKGDKCTDKLALELNVELP